MYKDFEGVCQLLLLLHEHHTRSISQCKLYNKITCYKILLNIYVFHSYIKYCTVTFVLEEF